ncbi:hypothetical protein AERO8C_120376 [Aeromonas veronii]|uniref:Uncharacterized protein n=1 Tax=Aeromonas veronii TaxID=654 RepID=A0A653KR80_AERVE|nr:hypothetical protein AERO8C_120376 [Aeromonas veronii]
MARCHAVQPCPCQGGRRLRGRLWRPHHPRHPVWPVPHSGQRSGVQRPLPGEQHPVCHRGHPAGLLPRPPVAQPLRGDPLRLLISCCKHCCQPMDELSFAPSPAGAFFLALVYLPHQYSCHYKSAQKCGYACKAAVDEVHTYGSVVKKMAGLSDAVGYQPARGHPACHWCRR